MLDGDFNKVAKPLVFSCKFAAYFQNTFFARTLPGDCCKTTKTAILKKVNKKVGK